MEKKMMKSNGAGSRSSAMKRRRLLSAAAVLLICCLVFVGAAGAASEYWSDQGEWIWKGPDGVGEIVIPELPKALVNNLTDSEWQSAPQLNVALNFTVNLPSEPDMAAAQKEYYKDWLVDFVFTINKDLTVGSSINAELNAESMGYFAGKYGGWGWIAGPTGNINIGINPETGKPIPMPVVTTGLGHVVTYEMIFSSVQTFLCGIYLSDVLLAEDDLEIGLDLMMVNPNEIDLVNPDINEILESAEESESTKFIVKDGRVVQKWNLTYVEEDESNLPDFGNPMSYTSGDQFPITLSNTPSKTGYLFAGWKDGDTEELIGSTITLSGTEGDKCYVATWTPNTYSVAFDANDGDGEMTQQPFTYDVEAELPENGFTRTGYQFNGWNTERDGSGTSYEDKATVKNLTSENGGTVTLYANWTAKSYTVTFNANGGSVTPESKTVTYGSPYGELPTPEWEGHTFKCWSQNSGGGMVFTEDVVVMSPNDHTLYAIWEENSAEGDAAPPISGGSSSGNYLSFPRTTTNGGLVDFGSSKVIKAVLLSEGSSGSVLLKVDTVEKWPKALDTEYPFDISVEKLGDGMAYIHFEIPVSVLESLELTPADICAYHFEGEVWTKLPTTYEVKDGTVCYEAATDSFSPFKLVIEEGAATQKEEENVPTVPPTETPDVPDEPEILPPIDEPTEPTEPTEPETPAPILAVLAGLGAAVIVRRK